MFALRLAEFMTSVLKFKPGRLRGHAVVIDRHSQKVMSPTVAQFSHRATRYSPVMIDLAMRDIWGSVLHTFATCLLTLKPPNRLSVPLATPARRGPTPRPPLGSGLSREAAPEFRLGTDRNLQGSKRVTASAFQVSFRLRWNFKKLYRLHVVAFA
jgi:hypothetical protein